MSSEFLPYKDKSQDGRVKLLPSRYPEVIAFYESVKSTRKTAAHFKVSRRLIMFILHPERLKEMQERHKAEKHWNKYYTTDQRKIDMQNYREKKRALRIPYKPPSQAQRERSNELRRIAYSKRKAQQSKTLPSTTPMS